MEQLVDKIDVPDQLEPVIALFGNHPWVKGLTVILIFIVLAKVVEWIVMPLVRRLTSHTSTHIDDLIVQYLRSPLFWTLVLIGVVASSSMMGIDESVRSTLVSFVLSVLILLWMLFAVRISKLLLSEASRRAKPNAMVRPQTLPLFTNIAAITIIVFAVYFMFQSWHVDMTAWLASAGIAGIAIGFAAKDTLANLFSGVFIMADSPYKIGDYVVLDDGGGIRGKVTHIGIRSTRLLTRDDVEVTIPNSIMGNSKVVNESGGPHVKYRIRVAVGVAYGSDIDQVRDVLMSVARESETVCEQPEPRVRFRAFGASSLDFELLCWVDNPELRGRVLDALNSAVYKRFLVEGIEIPFAKQDLYIKEMPDNAV
ncbi:MAG: mechanosensitive ion channel family protein [Candidatus Thiodiazotropha sp. (ex Lucina aurantia)]|nr:mechanosensitive ion channel family protein [Candidatus Thiodiazotropha taylori]MBT3043876.1 mechanosensitive ion channel family protein [Candidatus Thiodiazotropha sp. (ex Codakia orbicularis)]MBV2101175.1 mechanosensitive ion channel family protein [Candidatus Thiodiazotropha sp. (ex Codakia orbicularis)]MBV2105268.1 mechanosensitive ion channel family protein [Candidatus Thiodiazotropha sp. (ex Lucina aurantia)]MBV2119717.1 mechanosensitive ion channel family protein [Candidatus Thiodiazo